MHIDLERRFSPFSDGPTALHVEAHLQIIQGLGRDLGWDELLQDPYVVVLGEAGTGKTTEFKMQADRLRKSDQYGFFLDLTDLASGGLKLAISADQASALAAWKAGDGSAVFLLDSVDEAQLRQHSPRSALLRLAVDLGDASARARLVVSCRVSDWSSEGGFPAIEEFATAAGVSSPNVGLLQLMPLDNKRVGWLARHHGVTDPADLLEAVRQAGAQPFVARPLDVEWLAGYWIDEKKIGTLTQLIERSVSKRLEERRPKSCPRSQLSKAKAREGLTRLAGLATMCGRWSFQLPGEPAGGAATLDTLDPSDALPDWSPAELEELLTRAVFDESTYGRVRLHHRSVQEYLGAHWLQGMREAGMRVRELKRLLFRDVDGRLVVPAHLVPVAAWLSSFDADVLDKLIEAAPEALLQHGDPASLAPSIRERVLRSYLASYSDFEHRYDHFDHVALRRFAPALDAAVGAHLGRVDLPEEAVALLLQLASLGKLDSALEQALVWAQVDNASSRVRWRAFQAVGALADQTTIQTLVQGLLQSTASWNQDAAGSFASEFFPDHISVTQLGVLLRHVVPGVPQKIEPIKTFLSSEMSQNCPAAAREDMLSELLGVISATTQDRGWLLDGIQRLAAVTVAGLREDEEPGPRLREALLLLRKHDDVPFDGAAHRHELEEAIAPKWATRRWLFWTRVEEARARKNGEWPVRHFQAYHHNDLADLSAKDAPWLAEDAQQHAEPEARSLAFDCLLAMGDISEDLSEIVAHLASNDPVLANLAELDERRRSTPIPPDPDILEMQEEQAERARKRDEQRQENATTLAANISQIRSGKRYLGFLYERSGSGGSSYSGISLDKIAEKFGTDIAEAFAAGLKVFWRSYRPLFLFENDGAHTSGAAWGLAGLRLDFEAGLDPKTLSEVEVRSAARYAVLELNSFPEWFRSLTATHPNVVSDELVCALDADLRLGRDKQTELLRKFQWLPATLQDPFSTHIYSALASDTPVHDNALEDALRACEWLPASGRLSLASLCESKLRGSLSLDHACCWWRAWIWAEPEAAVGFLKEFAECAIPISLDEVVRALAAKMDSWPGERSAPLDSLSGCVPALEQLVPLVYASIRPEDDRMNRTRISSIVDDRAHAEAFRRSVFDALVQAGDAAALERVAADPRMAGYHDVLLKYSREALQRSVPARAMTPEEALEWSQNQAVPVQTPSELHQVAMDRLDDIKEHVETGESSVRSTYAAANEKDFQPWLMEQLETRNRHAYSVNREEEVDRGKMPDIRLAHSACPMHPVSIEIKVAENWSGPELMEALSDQLVGRYLRAAKSRHGILLLCSRGKRKKYRLGGKMRNLEGARIFLQAEADKIVHGSAAIDALDVVTIDFH